MKCTECGREFVPDCDQEEVCKPCQYEDVPEAKIVEEGEQQYPDDVYCDLDDGTCMFCGAKLQAKQLYSDCDDEEVYCPDCGYVESIG